MTCPVCDGVGSIERYYNEYDLYSEECIDCDGTGEVEDE